MLADDVWRYSPLGPIPVFVAGSLGLALVLYVTWVQSARTRMMTWALLAACILVILAATGRGSLGNEDGGFNWHLGASIAGELTNINRELGLLNVFGNVVMFVPVVWLAAILVRRRGLVFGAVSAAGFSAGPGFFRCHSPTGREPVAPVLAPSTQETPGPLTSAGCTVRGAALIAAGVRGPGGRASRWS